MGRLRLVSDRYEWYRHQRGWEADIWRYEGSYKTVCGPGRQPEWW